MTKVGIIGTGMLGEAVGLHLLDSNHTVTVFNRTKDKTEKLVDAGATLAESPKEVAENSDLVITVVRDADAVSEVAFGKDGIISGKHDDMIVADMSTINPNSAKEIFEKFKETFDTIAHQTYFLGDAGTAHSIKLAMNLQIAMLALSLSEGITLTRKAGFDPEVFLKILNSTYFKTGMSEGKAHKMIQDNFDPTFTLKNLKKDLDTINDAAKSFGANLPMAERADEVYQNAIEAGFSDIDYTGVLAYLKKINS